MRTFIKSAATLLTITLLTINLTLAQSPPPPNGGNDPGSGNTPVGGGAPIGSGVVLLIAMAAGYGGKKVYDARKGFSK